MFYPQLCLLNIISANPPYANQWLNQIQVILRLRIAFSLLYSQSDSQQMQSRLLTAVCALIITCFCPIATANPMALSLNRKYCYADTLTIDTSTSYNIMAKPTWNPNSYNISYPHAFFDSSVTGVLLSICDLDVGFVSNRTSFYGIVDSFSSSWFAVRVFSNFSYVIKVLSYRYLAYTDKYVNDYNWKCGIAIKSIQSQPQPLRPSRSMQSYTVSDVNVPVTLNSPFNSSSASNALLSLCGLDLNYSSSWDVGLRIWYYDQNITASELIFIVTIYLQLYIHTIHFTYLLWNKEYYSTRSSASFETEHIDRYWDTSSRNYTNIGNFYKPAIFLGTSYIQFDYTNYSSNVIFDDTSNSISINSSNPSQDIQMNLLIFYSYYCSYLNPYYYKRNDECYDICPDNTYPDQASLTCIQSSPSSPVPKIAGITAGAVTFIVVIAIIACFCYKRWRKRQEQFKAGSYEQPLPGINQSDANLANSVLHPLSISQLGVWRDRSNELSTKEECSFCLHEQAYFKTECQHVFHINCIVEWTKKKDDCPYCRKENITGLNHRVFCSKCKLREKWVKFSELVQRHEAGTLQEVVVCPSCKTIPI